MKQIMTIVAMCLMLSATQAQSVQQAVAEEIVEQCKGTITREGKSGESDYVMASLPSYYDEDLVKMAVSRVVRKYSNVNVYLTWRKDGDSIQVVLKVDEEFLIVSYTANRDLLAIAW